MKMKCDYYKGKKFSILGDSISTLEGYNPIGYKLFYTGDICEKAEVRDIGDTWWGKVIKHFGGELLVNNSWSGSRVTKLPNRERIFPSGCSDERTSALHDGSVMPDVIIVYMGTNDWAFGVTTEYVDSLLGEDTQLSEFRCAYNVMLQKIKYNYPNAEIWCCTLNTTYMSSAPDFAFPYTYGGAHIEGFNNRVRDIAKQNNCRLIDLYSCQTPYDSIDGSHPNVRGMETLASLMIRLMEERITESDELLIDMDKYMVLSKRKNFLARLFKK